MNSLCTHRSAVVSVFSFYFIWCSKNCLDFTELTVNWGEVEVLHEHFKMYKYVVYLVWKHEQHHFYFSFWGRPPENDKCIIWPTVMGTMKMHVTGEWGAGAGCVRLDWYRPFSLTTSWCVTVGKTQFHNKMHDGAFWRSLGFRVLVSWKLTQCDTKVPYFEKAQLNF